VTEMPTFSTVADPGFAKGGSRRIMATIGDRTAASLNDGLGRSPQRGPGAEAEPLMGVRGQSPPPPPLRLKGFCQFSYYKKCPNVKDLNPNLPTCLRQTVSRRHDQPQPPQVFVNGDYGEGIVFALLSLFVHFLGNLKQ